MVGRTGHDGSGRCVWASNGSARPRRFGEKAEPMISSRFPSFVRGSIRRSARGAPHVSISAISFIGAFRSPVVTALGQSRHAGDRKPAQKRTLAASLDHLMHDLLEMLQYSTPLTT